MAKQNTNPLSGHFRSPKKYTRLPSAGRYYSEQVVEMPFIKTPVNVMINISYTLLTVFIYHR